MAFNLLYSTFSRGSRMNIIVQVKLLVASAIIALVAIPIESWAISAYGDAFRSKYPNSPITTGGCNTCIVCHSNGANPETGNVYGYGNNWRDAWTSLEPGRTPTTPPNANAMAAFDNATVANGDPDGEGGPSISEIGAGSNPSGPGNVCPGGTTGGGNRTLNSLDGDFNPNALSGDCNFQDGGAGAGTVRSQSVQTDPVQVVTRGLVFLIPLLCVAYLKSAHRET
jgi:hypothetical protein